MSRSDAAKRSFPILWVAIFLAFAPLALAEDRKTIFDSDAAKHVRRVRNAGLSVPGCIAIPIAPLHLISFLLSSLRTFPRP